MNGAAAGAARCAWRAVMLAALAFAASAMLQGLDTAVLHATEKDGAPAKTRAGDTSLATRAARFPPVSFVRADFAQEREVSLVGEILRSSGRLSLTTPDRMRLELVAPERLTLLVEGANVTILDERNTPFPVAPESSTFAEFARVLTTLLLGRGTPGGLEEQWEGPDVVTLRPPEVAGLIVEIRLHFFPTSPLPETIVLRERNGDRTTIHLSGVRLDSSAP